MKRRRREGRLPFWGIAAAVLVVVAVLAVAQRRSLFPGETGGAASTPSGSVSTATPTVSVSVPDVPRARTAPTSSSPSSRAESGDLATLKAIETAEPSSRSAREVVALARGHQTLRRRAVQELGLELKRQPALAKDEATLRRLVRLARDPEVSIEVLAVIAELPGPVAADLLFVLWRDAPAGSARSLLSEDLLRSKDVRPRASEALSVWLDLFDARSCIARRALMPRSIEHADERSLEGLEALSVRTGCGVPPKAAAADGGEKDQDCHPCLREGDWLDRAIDAARDRKAPIDAERLLRSH